MKKALLVAFFYSFLCKAQPSFLWAKQFSGNSGGNSRAISTDNLGNVYSIGSFWGTVDFDPSPSTSTLSSVGQNDVFITKLDGAGNLIWAKQFGGTGQETGIAIASDKTGNMYITGRFYGTTDFDPGPSTYFLTGNSESFISKLDPAGNFVWAIQTKVLINSITIDALDNILATGHFYNVSDFDPGVGVFNLTAVGGADVFIWKLNSLGNFQWAKQIGGASSEVCYSIDVDKNKNAYISGFFSGTADFDPSSSTYSLTSFGGDDVFICKLNSNGGFVWAKQIGGANNEENFSIAVNKNYLGVTGYFANTVDFDPGPGTFNLTANASAAFTCKLDTSGNLIWARQMSGAALGYDIAFDNNDNVFTSGIFNYTVDFDPGAGTFNLSNSGPASMFVSKLDVQGNFICAGSIDGVSTDYKCLEIDKNGDIFLAGHFAGSPDFNADAVVFSMTSTSLSDIFIAKWTCGVSTRLIQDQKKIESDEIAVYPNPSSGLFQVSCSLTESCDIQIKICDALGRQIYFESIKEANGNYTYNIDLSKYSKGIYFIELVTERKRILKKVVVD